tara:strand:- start:440 stop:2455 length:2016 start_codon:yes stop_codon:yes gene_type:complete
MDAFVVSNKDQKNSSQGESTQKTEEYEINNVGKKAMNIKAQIENTSAEDLPKLLNKMCSKWGITNSPKYKIDDKILLGKRNFMIDDSVTIDKIEEGYDFSRLELALLNAAFLKNNLLTIDTEEEGDSSEEPKSPWLYRGLFDRLAKIIYYTEMTLRSNLMVETATDPTIDQGGEDLGLFRFTKFDETKNTPFQNLLIFLLKWLQERGYKKYQSFCCEKFYTEEGNYTHYMAPKFDIKDVPYKAIKKESNYEYWCHMTSGSNVSKVIDWLSNGDEVEFQTIKKDRNVFAFSNGIYVTADRTLDSGRWVDHFYEYGVEAIDEDIIACRFFDFPFRNELFDGKEYLDIPTPCVDRILEAQGFHEIEENKTIIRWLWAYIGRCLYDAGSMDNWQTAMFMRGKAGTGKSTVVDKIIGQFYDMEDVGNLSNNTEKQFGLQNQYDKLVVIAPEVKEDFTLNQAEFQQIVSAERMTIARKNNSVWIGEWKVPISMAGNEMPGWSDKAGSLQRRWVCWEFTKKVKQKDTKLAGKILKEMDAILKKANLAYLSALHHVGEDDIWKHLPKYFHDQQRKVAEHTNPLYDYLGSDEVKLGPEFHCRESEFKEHFNKFIQVNHLKKNKWNADFYESPFDSYDITRKKNCKNIVDSTGKVISGTVVLCGVEIIKDTGSDDEFEFED